MKVLGVLRWGGGGGDGDMLTANTQQNKKNWKKKGEWVQVTRVGQKTPLGGWGGGARWNILNQLPQAWGGEGGGQKGQRIHAWSWNPIKYSITKNNKKPENILAVCLF